MAHVDNNGKKWKQSYNRQIRRSSEMAVKKIQPDDETILVDDPMQVDIGDRWNGPWDGKNWRRGAGKKPRRIR